MTVDVKNREGVVIIAVTGEIVGSDALALKHVGDEQIDATENDLKIILDYTKVSYMDSSGLGVTVAFYTHVERKGGRIVLLMNEWKTDGPAPFNSFIVMAKMSTLYDFYHSEDEAIASFS